MYKAPMDPDDIAHSYDVICLENCAHPRHYISWCKQGANYEVKIYVRQRYKLFAITYIHLSNKVKFKWR